MANVSKIEKHGLGKTVLELSVSHTIYEILDILANEYNLKVGYKTVQRYIEGYREERRKQTRAVISEHIKDTVPTDLERLDKVIEKLNKRFDNANSDRDAAVLAAQLLKALGMKLDIGSGTNGSDEADDIVVYVPDDGRNPK